MGILTVTYYDATYDDLSIHQIITIKELIFNNKYRISILGKHNNEEWERLQSLRNFYNWKSIINYFITGQITNLNRN